MMHDLMSCLFIMILESEKSYDISVRSRLQFQLFSKEALEREFVFKSLYWHLRILLVGLRPF